ncbi:MAG: vesicular-fusion protein S17 [Chaenotheca gracillima]|nr:MAG: vesicular-fusion protein S17 [Chaenotheca gracillima]
MPLWGSSDQHKEEDKGEDLTTLLTRDQRSELTLLVSSITESMRKGIEDTFDASQTQTDIQLETKGDQDANPNEDIHAASAEEKEAAQKAQEKREKELSAPKLKELKAAALHSFDEWNSSVVLRIGEVVNSRASGDNDQDGKKASQPHDSNQHDDGADDNNDNAVDSTLNELYPPVATILAALPREKRILILHSMLLLLLSLEHYTAQSRILLLHITTSLKLSLQVLSEDEQKVAHGLLEAAKHMSGDEEAQKRSDENKTARRWKVGLASVGGAVLVGVTGGLAAPLLAAGVGSVMGGLGLGATAAAGYLGTLAGSGVLVGSLFGAYGGRMTGKMMDAYAREVQDFAFLPVRGGKKRHWSSAHEASPEDRRLRVAIGITGWLTEKEEIVTPWRVIGQGVEVFALRWELDALQRLGNALTAMVKSAAWSYAKSEIIKRTIFASLTAALWPIGLLKISRVVDNPFSVARSRSEKAGEVLADALINKAQGERPVTLIGYSLGARVIYSCLTSLASRRAFGLIESVVLIGAPAPSSASDWRAMRSVVAGRLINVYSENDYILGFLYRTSSIQYGVAGLQKVEGVKGVEDVNVSDMVSGHLRYRYLVGSILSKVGFEDIEPSELEREEEALKLADMKEKEEEEKKEKQGDKDAEEEAKALEKDLQKKNEQREVEAATERMRIS